MGLASSELLPNHAAPGCEWMLPWAKPMSRLSWNNIEVLTGEELFPRQTEKDPGRGGPP